MSSLQAINPDNSGNSGDSIGSFIPAHQRPGKRPGRPKVAREPISEDERRKAELIATRKAAMSPIKAQLAKLGKTQAWLIGQLDERAHLSISQQTISNYLNGHAGIAEDTLIWVCAITGVSVQEILGGVPDRTMLLQAVKRPLRYQRHGPKAKNGAQPAENTGEKSKSRHVDA